jgi:hypothetical protein
MDRKVLRISGLAGRARLHRRSRPDLCAKNQPSINPLTEIMKAEKTVNFFLWGGDGCQRLDIQKSPPTEDSQAKEIRLSYLDTKIASPHNEITAE